MKRICRAVLIAATVALFLPSAPAGADAAPVAQAQTVAATEDVSVAITLSGSDADADPLQFQVVTAPSRGVLTGTAPNLTYKSKLNHAGPDSFTFRVSDGQATSAPATVTVNVAPVNDPPGLPADKTYGVRADQPRLLILRAQDPDLQPVTFVVTSSPLHGVVTGTPPEITYTPDAGYLGDDSFTVSASDGLLTVEGIVRLFVTHGPGAPPAPAVNVARSAAAVTVTAPAETGGVLITGYFIYVYDGVTLKDVYRIAAPERTLNVYGLNNGRSYTFTAKPDGLVQGQTSPPSPAPATPSYSAPYPSCGAGVDDIYARLLNRPPNAFERTVWTERVGSERENLTTLMWVLRHTQENRTEIDPVIRLYRAYFQRTDHAGLQYWVARRRAGASLSRISAYFAGSAEFVQRYGELDNRGFVELVYQNVLGRPGDPGGIDYWTAQLDSGARTRGQVMVGFSESAEFVRTQDSEVQTVALYSFMVRRAPTPSEFAALVDELDGGGSKGFMPVLLEPDFAARVS